MGGKRELPIYSLPFWLVLFPVLRDSKTLIDKGMIKAAENRDMGSPRPHQTGGQGVSQIILYQSEDGRTKLNVQLESQTVFSEPEAAH